MRDGGGEGCSQGRATRSQLSSARMHVNDEVRLPRAGSGTASPGTAPGPTWEPTWKWRRCRQSSMPSSPSLFTAATISRARSPNCGQDGRQGAGHRRAGWVRGRQCGALPGQPSRLLPPSLCSRLATPHIYSTHNTHTHSPLPAQQLPTLALSPLVEPQWPLWRVVSLARMPMEGRTPAGGAGQAGAHLPRQQHPQMCRQSSLP